MDKRTIWAIAAKDMRAIRSSVQIWLPMLIIPLVFCLLLPLGLTLGLRYAPLEAMGNIDSMVAMLENLPPGSLKERMLSWPEVEQTILYFTAVYMFAPLFLLIPLMVSSVVAANSFVGEKEAGTLESLLYSPIDLMSLFVGKVLSAFVPAMLLTLGSAVIYTIVINVSAYPLMGEFILPQWNWVLLLLWVTPAISLGAILINVVISARVKGFQEAYQLGGMVVLPIIAVFAGQMMGWVLFDTRILATLGLLIALLDWWGLRRIVASMDRTSLFASQVR